MNIYEEIQAERERQDRKWGTEFDDKNTANDWTAYIAQYAGLAAFSTQGEEWRTRMIQVAALAVAALEAQDRNKKLPPRHYER